MQNQKRHRQLQNRDLIAAAHSYFKAVAAGTDDKLSIGSGGEKQLWWSAALEEDR
jgi:hypothetical protein